VIEVESHAVPMHIFVDLEQMLRKEGNWSFLSEATGDALDSTDETPRFDLGRGGVDHLDSVESEVDTPHSSPQVRGAREKRNERQNPENFIIKDLDLDFDYRSKNIKAGEAVQKGKGLRKVELCFSALFNISYSSFAASRSSVNFKGIDEA
jgi:autophagy-related protein 2